MLKSSVCLCSVLGLHGLQLLLGPLDGVGPLRLDLRRLLPPLFLLQGKLLLAFCLGIQKRLLLRLITQQHIQHMDTKEQEQTADKQETHRQHKWVEVVTWKAFALASPAFFFASEASFSIFSISSLSVCALASASSLAFL